MVFWVRNHRVFISKATKAFRQFLTGYTEEFIIFLNAAEEPQALTQEFNKALLLLFSINGGDSFSCPRIEVFRLQAFEMEKSGEQPLGRAEQWRKKKKEKKKAALFHQSS